MASRSKNLQVFENLYLRKSVHFGVNGYPGRSGRFRSHVGHHLSR